MSVVLKGRTKGAIDPSGTEGHSLEVEDQVVQGLEVLATEDQLIVCWQDVDCEAMDHTVALHQKSVTLLLRWLGFRELILIFEL